MAGLSDKIRGNSDSCELDDESVSAYLEAHPDFLLRHPELLSRLEIAHPAGDAVSLVEKQVAVLRERNTELRRRLTTLVANARANDDLYEKTRDIVARLLEADSPAALIACYRKSMVQVFRVDFASALFFEPALQPEDGRGWADIEQARAVIGPLLKGRKAFAGILRELEFRFLFGDNGSEGSAASVVLQDADRELGIIAVGSRDPHRYGSDTGTLFLAHIGDVMSRLAAGMM